MSSPHGSTPITRRSMLAKLVAGAASLTGISAFARIDRSAAVRAPWDDRFELAVDLEIGQQDGFRSHRPYVAVWVEDPTGNPVRTLSLWVNNRGRGPRYIRELRRWFRGERASDLVDTISSATRLPGKYTLLWNGRDDAGKPVSQGPYVLFIEAAREHGTYQLMRQEVTVATKPFAADLPGNEEIQAARVEYRARR